MAFDPSVISQISDYGPNPAAAKMQAYTLASQMDQQTLHSMQLKQAQQQERDEEKAKQIVRQSNNSSAQDRLETAERLRKEVGPDYSNRFLKEAQAVESGALSVHIQKLQAASMQQEAIVGAMDSVIRQVEEFRAQNPGASDAMLDAKTQQIGFATMRSLAEQQPELRVPIAQFAATPGAQKFAGWQAAEAVSKEGQKMIATRLAEHKEAINAEELKVRQKAQDTRDRLADISEERVELARKKEAAAEEARKEGLLGDAEVKDMAKQYIAGDKNVLVGVGRGKQGPANIANLRKEIRLESERQGLSPVDRAARMASFAALMSEEQALGRRQATIEVAAAEADRVFPIVERAASKVPRGNWVPWNALVQNYEKMMSDPKLGAFAQAIDSTVNVYARAIQPTGVPHEAARARALQILSTVTSQADFEAKIDVMKAEIQAALDSPDDVREKILASFKASVAPRPGSVEAQAAGPPATTPPPRTTPPPGGPPPAGGPPDDSQYWLKPRAAPR